jgi:Reverse transcriptase (RNA-dependent DNA polymerase)
MSRVAARITDKRVLKLIRAFLNAGVLEGGLVLPVDEGTPQGDPLSPFLSNIVLDDLDKELARRGHRFCRYAEDCNIYVRSHRAGERVIASISRFLTDKLRLKVNEAKSAVARPGERKFLGFSISNDRSERRVAPQALNKFKISPIDDPPDTRDQPTAADRRPHAIPHWVARVLRLLPDPPRANEPGSVDPPKITLVSLAAVAERAQPLQRTAPSRRPEVQCSGRRQFADGVLAHVRPPSGPTRTAQPLLRLDRSPPPPCLCPSVTQSNRRGT